MKKKDFRKCINGMQMPRKRFTSTELDSVTDPSYAQSVHEMLVAPKPYEMRQIYSNGIPLDQMQPFDGMYKDKHEAFQSALEFSDSQSKDIKEKLKNIKENESKTKVTE